MICKNCGNHINEQMKFCYLCGTPVNDVPANESRAISILKGILGAFIGALPGVVLYIILFRIGLVASIVSFVMMSGIIFGYKKMTKNCKIPVKLSFAVCLIIFVIVLCMAHRVCWALEWNDLDVLMRNGAIELLINDGYTQEEAEELITDEMVSYAAYVTYGVKDFTFWQYFLHIHKLIKADGLTGEYFISLGQSALFGALGVYAFFDKKLKKLKEKSNGK